MVIELRVRTNGTCSSTSCRNRYKKRKTTKTGEWWKLKILNWNLLYSIANVFYCSERNFCYASPFYLSYFFTLRFMLFFRCCLCECRSARDKKSKRLYHKYVTNFGKKVWRCVQILNLFYDILLLLLLLRRLTFMAYKHLRYEQKRMWLMFTDPIYSSKTVARHTKRTSKVVPTFVYLMLTLFTYKFTWNLLTIDHTAHTVITRDPK